MKFISTNIETAREARHLYNEGIEKNNRPQQTPVEAVNKIYQELNNICFNAPLPDFDSSTIYIDRNFLKNSLDTLQSLHDKCSGTNNVEFNKLVRKLLGSLASLLYYYYNRSTPYMDQFTYRHKFWLDIQSIRNVANFFYNKYILGYDCYLVMIETDNALDNIFKTKNNKAPGFAPRVFLFCTKNQSIFGNYVNIINV